MCSCKSIYLAEEEKTLTHDRCNICILYLSSWKWNTVFKQFLELFYLAADTRDMQYYGRIENRWEDWSALRVFCHNFSNVYPGMKITCLESHSSWMWPILPNAWNRKREIVNKDSCIKTEHWSLISGQHHCIELNIQNYFNCLWGLPPSATWTVCPSSASARV